MEDVNNFHKQRRNLMLISSILIFQEYLKINFENISLFYGITIGASDRIPSVLWVLWGYFFYRYINFFSEKNVWNSGNLHMQLSGHLINKARKIGKKKNGIDLTKAILHSESTDIYRQHYQFFDPKNHFTRVLLYEHKYTPMRTKIEYIPILIKDAIARSKFSEFYFPFIYASAPIFICLCKVIF